MKNNSKILVTGATGFIGSCLVEELIRKGFEVKCLALHRDKAKKIRKMGCQMIYGDAADLAKIKEAVSDVDVVFHLAAIRGRTDKTIGEYRRVNVEGLKNILEAAGKEKRIIYCSSVGVLGWPKEELAVDDSPYRLTAGNRYYHLTKIEAEKMARQAISSGYKITIVRPTIVYGKNDSDGMIFKLVKMIKQKRYFPIGRGDNRLRLTDVRNLVDAFLLILDNKNSVGKLYTIGDSRAYKIKEIVNAISQSLKVKIPSFYIPVFLAKLVALPTEIVFKAVNLLSFGRLAKEPPIDIYRINLLVKNQNYDISRVQKELGYKPKFDTLKSIAELAKLC